MLWAAFLIPYFTCMFDMGISGILIESTMGQYSGQEGFELVLRRVIKARHWALL